MASDSINESGVHWYSERHMETYDPAVWWGSPSRFDYFLVRSGGWSPGQTRKSQPRGWISHYGRNTSEVQFGLSNPKLSRAPITTTPLHYQCRICATFSFVINFPEVDSDEFIGFTTHVWDKSLSLQHQPNHDINHPALHHSMVFMQKRFPNTTYKHVCFVILISCLARSLIRS